MSAFGSATRQAALEDAALALYMAGRWELPRYTKLDPNDQGKLWEDLREALDLEPGHSTNAGGP